MEPLVENLTRFFTSDAQRFADAVMKSRFACGDLPSDQTRSEPSTASTVGNEVTMCLCIEGSFGRCQRPVVRNAQYCQDCLRIFGHV